MYHLRTKCTLRVGVLNFRVAIPVGSKRFNVTSVNRAVSVLKQQKVLSNLESLCATFHILPILPPPCALCIVQAQVFSRNCAAPLHYSPTTLVNRITMLIAACSWTYPTAECVDSVGLTLMRNALLEPTRAFSSGDLLGVFLILLAGAIIAFIVAGINRFLLCLLGLYREVFSFYVSPVYSLT